jgi:hypothetical protein
MDVVGGQPGDTVLASVTFAALNNWGWHGAPFPDPIDVQAGETLAVVFRGTNSTTAQNAQSDNGNPYAGGTGYISTDSGGTWNPVQTGQNADISFQALVQPFSTFNTPGTIESVTISPTTVSEWGELSFTTDEPANTSIVVHVLYDSGGGTWVAIPDVDLGGNGTGFAVGDTPVDISALNPATYPAIRLQAELATTDTAVTPELLDWQVTYKP